MHYFYFIVLGVLVLLVLFSPLPRNAHINTLRRRGIYPAKGKESIEDVDTLLREGYAIPAIHLYRHIEKCSFKTAKRFVVDRKAALMNNH
jgi:hypothetical protein